MVPIRLAVFLLVVTLCKGSFEERSSPQRSCGYHSNEIEEENKYKELRLGLSSILGSLIALSALSPQDQCVLKNLPEDYVLVAPGDSDDVGLLLNVSRINFTTVAGRKLHTSQTQRCRSLFINSEALLLQEDPSKPMQLSRTEKRLKRFARSGGVVLTTDHAVQLIRNGSHFVPNSDCWVAPTKRVSCLPKEVSISRAVKDGSAKCATRSNLDIVFTVFARVLADIDPDKRTLASPTWSLRSHTDLLRIKRPRECRRMPNNLHPLFTSNDLLGSFNNLLVCADIRKGSYFHVVGRLGQFNAHPSGNGITDLHFDVIFHQLLPNVRSDMKNAIKNMASQLAESGWPLTVENIATAAISFDIVHRVILKSWLPQCRAQQRDLVRQCFQQQAESSAPTATWSDSFATPAAPHPSPTTVAPPALSRGSTPSDE